MALRPPAPCSQERGVDKNGTMTTEERRKRPAHHVVHDYANLVSSGRLALDGAHKGIPLVPPINTHVGHAFYMNCRKMYEFFTYPPKRNSRYLRAQQFLREPVPFKGLFKHWNKVVQQHMDIHLLHVGGDRTTRDVAWTGDDNDCYLEDFEGAWALFLANLKPKERGIFRDEIDYRLNSEFSHCGDLGRQFIA